MVRHMHRIALLMLIGCLSQGWADEAFGTWKAVPRLANDGRAKRLVVRFQPHSKGEVFTLDRVDDNGRSTTSSTILYFDGQPRDLQDFECSGTQVSRRLDNRTVEIVRNCSDGGWTRFVGRMAANSAELVFEITVQKPGGRRDEERLVMERSKPEPNMKLNSIPSLVLFGIVCQGPAAIALAQSSGVFTSTGSMITPRSNHSATLLPSGKVLLVGDAYTAELYDPSTGAFTLTGSPIAARALHGAVLLPDGRVLIVGGSEDGSAEVYDPATGSFGLLETIGLLENIVSGSYGWTIATLLNDGRVLIARGTAPPFGASNAGLYDPSDGTFTRTGDLVWDHLGPVATLLADGRVLIVEGRDPACETTPGAGPCGGTEIFDPATGVFSATGSVSGEPWRGGPNSTLLSNGQVLVAGGDGGNGYLSTAELYDPSARAFTPTQSMNFARSYPTSTLLPNGMVLLAGGNRDTPNGSIFTAEQYNPSTATYSPTGNMAAYRVQSAATLLLDGSVLITGGGGNGKGSAEIFHPAVLIPAPLLFSLSGDGRGHGAIWNPATGQIAASPGNPAVVGTILSLYTTSLIEGGVIPPQVSIGGRLAEVLYFGAAPGYPGYYQVNFRVPSGAVPGQAVPVRLTYLGRPSNAVTIAVN